MANQEIRSYSYHQIAPNINNHTHAFLWSHKAYHNITSHSNTRKSQNRPHKTSSLLLKFAGHLKLYKVPTLFILFFTQNSQIQEYFTKWMEEDTPYFNKKTKGHSYTTNQHEKIQEESNTTVIWYSIFAIVCIQRIQTFNTMHSVSGCWSSFGYQFTKR